MNTSDTEKPDTEKPATEKPVRTIKVPPKPKTAAGVKEAMREGDAEPYEIGKLYQLNMDAIMFNPRQPRKYFDNVALEELKSSIEKHGVLQPVLFCKMGEDLMLVAGERRHRAAELAGKKTIPGIYIEGNSDEIALVENLLREDLNPIEEAEALEQLKKHRGYKYEELSAVINKAVSTISEILSLNRLPEDIKGKCRSNPKVSRRALVEIAKGKDVAEMNKRFKKYEKENLTGDALRADTRKPKAPIGIDAVLQTLAEGLCSKLREINLTDIGEEKRKELEAKLMDLIRLIKEKLG